MKDWTSRALCANLVPPCTRPGCRHKRGCPQRAAESAIANLFYRTELDDDDRTDPDGFTKQNDEEEARAVRICFDCPVWKECIRDAAERHPLTRYASWRYGVRGGLTEKDRRGAPGKAAGLWKEDGTPDIGAALAKAEAKRRQGQQERLDEGEGAA